MVQKNMRGNGVTVCGEVAGGVGVRGVLVVVVVVGGGCGGGGRGWRTKERVEVGSRLCMHH